MMKDNQPAREATFRGTNRMIYNTPPIPIENAIAQHPIAIVRVMVVPAYEPPKDINPPKRTRRGSR